jgi:hypothetical protein
MPSIQNKDCFINLPNELLREIVSYALPYQRKIFQTWKNVSTPHRFIASMRFANDFAPSLQNSVCGGYQTSTYSASYRMAFLVPVLLMICSPILISFRRWDGGKNGMNWTSECLWQSKMSFHHFEKMSHLWLLDCTWGSRPRYLQIDLHSTLQWTISKRVPVLRHSL